MSVYPPDRTAANIAYDTRDGYVLLFGGTSSYYSQPLNDTWAYSSGVWTEIFSRESPPAFNGAAMVDDPTDGYVLLLGPDILNDSWAFSGGQWTHLAPSTAPAYRFGECLAYDATAGFVMLFGGISGTHFFQDTWTLSAGNWTLDNTALSPWPRYSAGCTDDPTDSGVLLVGGTAVISGVTGPVNDTWVYNGTDWARSTGSPPSGFVGTPSALGIDPTSNLMLLISGCGDAGCAAGYWNIWTYAAGSWSLRGAPYPTLDGTAGFETGTFGGGVLLFGGLAPWEVLSVAEWFNGTWTTRAAPFAPTPTANPLNRLPEPLPMAYDASDGYVLAIPNYSTSYYTYAAGNWSVSTTSYSPAPRSEESLSWDSRDGCVVLFGGLSSSYTALGDTWEFYNAHWHQVNQSPSDTWPAPRANALLVDDPALDEVLLYGGDGFNDTWTYAAGNWTMLAGAGSPPARYQAAIAYDASDSEVVLFGGVGQYCAGVYSYCNETWTFSNGNWTNRTASLLVQPSGRTQAVMSAEVGRAGVLLFGGQYWPAYQYGGGGGESILNDTWEYDNGTWTDLTFGLSPTPPSRFAAGMAADPGDGYDVMFGGDRPGSVNAGTPAVDTWAWGLPGHESLVVNTLTANEGEAEVGVPVVISASVSGGTPPVTLFYPALPPGCASINSASLSCVPTASGSFPIAVTATDATGRVARGAGTLLVAPHLTGARLSINGSTVAVNGTVYLGASSSGGVAPLSYSYSGLPPGCAAPAGSGGPCRPTVAGVYIVMVRITDALAVWMNASATLTVTKATTTSPLMIQSFVALPSTLTLGQPVRLVVNLTGGVAPYSFVYSGLPSGCATTDEADWVCVPGVTGNFDVVAHVSDAAGAIAEALATLTVGTAAGLTVLGFVAAPATLPVGQTVTVVAETTGGIPPVTLAVSGLPSNCVQSPPGIWNCVPTEAGTYHLALTAQDASGTTVSATTSFVVTGNVSTPIHKNPVLGNVSTVSVADVLVAGAVGGIVGGLATALIVWSVRRRP